MFAVRNRGFTAPGGQFASMALVNLEPLLAAVPATALVVNETETKLASLVDKMCSLHDFEFNPKAIGNLLKTLAGKNGDNATVQDYLDTTFPLTDAQIERLESLQPLDRTLIEFLANEHHARSGEAASAHWNGRSMPYCDPKIRTSGGTARSIRAARTLYFGPYLALPAGHWTVTLTFEVQECFSDNSIEIDVAAGKVLAIIRAKLPARGVYRCPIEFEHVDPTLRVEVRLRLLVGAIEGRLSLQKIGLDRSEAETE